MIVVVAFLMILILSYQKFWLGRRRMYDLVSKLPSPKGYPLIGHVHLFTGNNEALLETIDTLSDFTQKNGGISKVWMGPFLYVVLTNPADVEIVLNSCLQKDRVYNFFRPWLGNGLVCAPVNIWKRHRRMLTPAFNQNIIDGFVDIFWEQSNTLMEKIRPNVGGSAFDIFSYVTINTLNTLCQTIMGVKINPQKCMDTKYLQSSISQMDIIYKRAFKIWLQPDFLFNFSSLKKCQDHNIKHLHAFRNELISKKRQDYANQENPDSPGTGRKIQKPFLDFSIDLTDKDQKLTDVELREEVDTITLGSIETSALISSYALVMIGSHPLVQKKIVAELGEIFGESKRKITRGDLSDMQYLDRVIKETLRLYPVVPVIARLAEKDIKLTSAAIPAGTGCIISIWGLHRDKSIWGDDAHIFDPDRFLPERSAERHLRSFIPFSYGARDCIGRRFSMMSIKILLSNFLQNYIVKATPYLPVKAEIMLKPVHGHFISIEERKSLIQT